MISSHEYANLKPGDKVRIVAIPPEKIHDEDPYGLGLKETWVETMDGSCGNIGTVVRPYNRKDKDVVQIEYDDMSFGYLPQWIEEVVKEETADNPTTKTTALEDIMPKTKSKRTKIEEYEKKLVERFPGREEAIHAALLGILSGHPVFFLGPPGTAKSLILSTIADTMNLKKFEKLITDYTLPEELFGPINIPEMKKGSWSRITTDMLPEANIAFLDEIFKSTTILNTLLRIINERKYKNGKIDMDIPLYTLFAASNEIPSDPSLLALYDRLVIRVVTDSITNPATLIRMKQISHDTTWKPPKFPVNLDKAIKEIKNIKINDELIHLATEIELNIISKGIIISNRKQVQAIDVMKASAYIHGRKEVALVDLHVMKYLYWNVIEDIPIIEDIVATNITPALSDLKKIKSRIFSDINDAGPHLKKSLQQQHMLWATSKALLEKVTAPKSEEEKEMVLNEIVEIINILDEYTPLLTVKPKPRFTRW